MLEIEHEVRRRRLRRPRSAAGRVGRGRRRRRTTRPTTTSTPPTATSPAPTRRSASAASATTNFVTYKGPKRDAADQDRAPRSRCRCADGDEAGRRVHAELLTHLGYRPVAVVRKRRASYHAAARRLRRGASASTTWTGWAASPSWRSLAAERAGRRGRAAVLLALAAELGLTQVEPRSYLELLLAARREDDAMSRRSPPPSPRSAPPSADARGRGQTVGLVPTMGALHDGPRSA